MDPVVVKDWLEESTIEKWDLAVEAAIEIVVLWLSQSFVEEGL